MAVPLGHARLRVAIIGVGKHGSRYAEHAARDVEGLELVAICRRDRAKGEALATQLGCEFDASAENLLRRRDIDAAILVTVPRLVPAFVSLAVETGKRLIIEKPVAPTLEGGRAMLATIEKSGVYCMAGHTLRFNSAVEALRRELPSLGRIDSMLFSQRFPPQQALAWLDQPKESGGGNILHTGVHCFDLLRWLSGLEVNSVVAQARAVYTERTEDLFSSLLEMNEPRLIGQVSCSRTTSSRNGLVEVSGENGQIVIDHVLGTGYRLSSGGREELAIDAPRMTVRALLERFVDDARHDRPPSITYRDGLAAVAVAEACYRSMGSRCFETVQPL